MRYSKVLANNNRIISDTFSHRELKPMVSDFSLRFVFSGAQNYKLGQRQLSVHPDSFLFINQGTVFTSNVESSIPVQTFAIDFAPRFVIDFQHAGQISDHQLLDNFQNLPTYGNHFAETIYPLNSDMQVNVNHLKNYLDAGLSNEMLINEYLHHCLNSYYNTFNQELTNRAENLSSIKKHTRTEILRRLNLAREYMLSNYNQNLNLENIADYACLSVNHFLRTFKQAFDQSPHQFIMKTRLERARILMKTTAYPISEIVNLIGFECPSSFARLFKTHYQISPNQYRFGAA